MDATRHRRWVAPSLMAVATVATAAALITSSRQGEAPTFIVWVAIAGLAYLGMLAAQRRWTGLTPRAVVAAGVCTSAAAFAVPPRATGDLWMYAVYGRMATHHLNPWTNVPAVLPADALTRAAGRRWMHTPSMYGPVMVWIERAVSPALGPSTIAARLTYQGLALLAVAACAAILWRRTRSVGALAFLVVNPVVTIHLVNGGRNDILVGLAVLVAAVLVADGHDALPAVIVASAVLVKLTAGVGVLAIVGWLLVRRGRGPALRAAVAAGCVVVAGTVLAGPASLTVPLRKAGRLFSAGSVWSTFGRLHVQYPPSRVAVALAAAVMVLVLGRHLRGSPALAIAAALAAWTLALPYMLPGYLGWTLAVAALERRSRVAAVLAVQSVVLAAGYAAERNAVAGWPAVASGALGVAMPVAAFVGLAVLVLDRSVTRPTQRASSEPYVDTAGDAMPVRAVVVVPTYNEAANAAPLLRRIRAACPDLDVLVVDDDSPDGTAARVAELAPGLGGVEVLRRPARAGLGTAYCDGFRLALARGYDLVCEMDADLSHEPEALPALLAAAAGGADLVIGSRYVAGGRTVNWSTRRRVLSRCGGTYARVLLGLPVRDATSGFRAYRADQLRRVDLADVRASGYGFQIEMTYRVVAAGGRIAEVPITFRERAAGRSKMSAGIVVEALAMVTRLAVRRIAGGVAPAPGPELARR